MNREAKQALQDIEHVDRFVSIPDVHIDNRQRETIHQLANQAKQTIRELSTLDNTGNFSDIIQHQTIERAHDAVINAVQHAVAPDVVNVIAKPLVEKPPVYNAREADLMRQIAAAENEVVKQTAAAQRNLNLAQRLSGEKFISQQRVLNLAADRAERIKAKNRAIQKIKLLRAELARVQGELATATGELAVLKAERDTLHALIHGDAKQAGYIRELASVKAQLAAATAANAKLTADLATSQTDEAAARVQIAAHAARITALTQAESVLQNNLAAEKASRAADTATAAVALAAVQKQLADEIKKFIAEQQTVAQCRQDIVALTGDIAREQAEVRRLTAQLSVNAASLAQLAGEKYTAEQTAAAEIAALKTQQTADGVQLAALTSDLQKARAQIAQLTAQQATQHAASQAEEQKLNNQISQLQQQQQTDAAQIAAHEATIQGLNTDIQQQTAQRAANVTLIQNLNDEIAKLKAAQQTDQQQATQQIAAHEATIRGLNTDIQQLQAAQQAQQTQIAAQLAEVQKLKQQKTADQQTEQKLNGEIAQLKAQQAAQQAASAVQIAALNQSVSDLQDQIKLDTRASQAAAQQADTHLKAAVAAQQSAEQAKQAADVEVSRLQLANQLLNAQLITLPKAKKKKSGKLAAQLANERAALAAALQTAQQANQQARQAADDLQKAQQANQTSQLAAAAALQKQKEETQDAKLEINKMMAQKLLDNQEIADLKKKDLSALLATIHVSTEEDLKLYIDNNESCIKNLKEHRDNLDEIILRKKNEIATLTRDNSDYELKIDTADSDKRISQEAYNRLRSKVIEVFKLSEGDNVINELSKYTETLSEFEKKNIDGNLITIYEMAAKMNHDFELAIRYASSIQTGPMFSKIFAKIDDQIKQLATPEVGEFIERYPNLQFDTNDPFTENHINNTNKQDSMLLLTVYYITRLHQVKSEVIQTHGDIVAKFQVLDEYAASANTPDALDTVQRFAAFQKSFHTIETTTNAAFGAIISDIKDWVEKYKIADQPAVDDSDDEQNGQPAPDQPSKPATVNRLLNVMQSAPTDDALDPQLDDDFAAPAPLNQSINEVYGVLKEICGKLNIPVASLPTSLNIQVCVTNIKKAIEQQAARHEAERQKFITDLQATQQETEKLKITWAEVVVLRQQVEKQTQEIAQHAQKMAKIQSENDNIRQNFDARLRSDVTATGIFTKLTEENAILLMEVKSKKEEYERNLEKIQHELKIRTQMTSLTLDKDDHAALDAKITESLSDLQKQISDPALRDALADKIKAEADALVAQIAERKQLERVKMISEQYYKISDHAALHQRYIEHETQSQQQMAKMREAVILDVVTIKELRAQIHQQTGENDELNGELIKTVEENVQLMERLEIAAQSATATEAERDQLRAARDDLEAKLIICLEDNKIQHLDITRITQELSDAKQEAERLKIAVEKANDENQAATARINQLTKRKPIMAPIAKIQKVLAATDATTALTDRESQIKMIITEFSQLEKMLVAPLKNDTSTNIAAKKKIELIRNAIHAAKEAPVTGGAQPRQRFNFEYIFIITVLIVLTVYLLYLIHNGRSKRVYQSRDTLQPEHSKQSRVSVSDGGNLPHGGQGNRGGQPQGRVSVSDGGNLLQA